MNVGEHKDSHRVRLDEVNPKAPRYLNGRDCMQDGRLLKRGHVNFGVQLAESIEAAVKEFLTDIDTQRRGIGVASFGPKRRDIIVFYHKCPQDGLVHFWIDPLPQTDEQVIDNLRRVSKSHASNASYSMKKLLAEAADRIEENHVANREAIDRLNAELVKERRNIRAAQMDIAAWKSVAKAQELNTARKAEEVARVNIILWKMHYEAAQEKTKKLQTTVDS
jgi:hypothetical protein